MLVKLVIAVVIVILLRRHLGLLKSLRSIWPIGIGLAVGGVPGWLYATLLLESGQAFAPVLHWGVPAFGIKLAFALIGACATVKPVSEGISSFFSPKGDGK